MSTPTAAAVADFDPLACPVCLEPVIATGAGRTCDTCRIVYRASVGWLDFIGADAQRPAGFGPRAMQSRSLARIYDSAWRPLYMSMATAQRADFDAEFEVLQGYLESATGGTLLDLSCGPGLMARRLYHSGDWSEVWGLDLSIPMLQSCAHANREADADIPLVRADVSRMPLATGSFDAIHAGAALHLWPDRAAAVREVARVLAPGGVFVASTFVRSQGSLLLSMAERVFGATTTTRFFGPGELEDLCQAAGLTDYEATIRSGFIILAAIKPPL